MATKKTKSQNWRRYLPLVIQQKERFGKLNITFRRQVLYLALHKNASIKALCDSIPLNKTTYYRYKHNYEAGLLGPRDLKKNPPLRYQDLERIVPGVKPVRNLDPYEPALIYPQSEHSLYDFCRDTLGYDLLCEKPHREFCKQVEDLVYEWQAKRKEGLSSQTCRGWWLPRGGLKSTIVDHALPLWVLHYIDPNVRILFYSETRDLSRNNMNTCRNHMESNEKFRECAGDWTRDKDMRTNQRWGAYELDIRPRTDFAKREPSMNSAGIDVVRTGFHYDMILFDDMHSEKNTSTAEQIEKVRSQFRLAFALLEPDGIALLTGTRWHDSDYYGEIIREEADLWRPVVVSASRGGEDGGVWWPERLNADFLKEQKRRLGKRLYNAQYENDPTPTGEQELNAANVHVYSPTSDYRSQIQKIRMTVDPAVTTKKTSDHSVVSVYGWDALGGLWLLDGFKDKLKIAAFLRRMWTMMLKWRKEGLRDVGIETVGFQQYIKFEIERKIRETHYTFNLVELKPKQQRKVDRIRRLSPLLENGNIHVPPTMFYHSVNQGEDVDFVEQLREEMNRFPFSRSDDLLDCMAYQLDVGALPNRMSSVKERLDARLDPNYRHFLKMTKYSSPYASGNDWFNGKCFSYSEN